jgi:integrase
MASSRTARPKSTAERAICPRRGIKILAAGTAVYSTRTSTTAAYLEKWLASVVVNRKPSTAATYEDKMRRYVIPRIGAMPLRAVDPATLDALYAELLQRGGRSDKDGNPTPISAQTVAVVHRILHRALGDAAKRRIIRSNPAADAEVPKSSKPQERKAWNADEMRAFLAHVADDRLRALWLLFTTTGLRRGEACGAMWSDVQLDGKKPSLVVRRNRVPVRGKVTEGTPRFDRTRLVALAPETVSALRAHREAAVRGTHGGG